jgi:hypothetical protein
VIKEMKKVRSRQDQERAIKRNEEGVIKTREEEGVIKTREEGAIKGKRDQLRWRKKEGPPTGLTLGDQSHGLFQQRGTRSCMV